jgi:arginine decarboxylase
MRSLDTPEVHGYRADLGYRVYVDKALEIAATARPAPPPVPPALEDAAPAAAPDAALDAPEGGPQHVHR